MERDGRDAKAWEKALARLVATIIVTFFRILEAILAAIFNILSSLAKAL